jgi:hypothetical protein
MLRHQATKLKILDAIEIDPARVSGGAQPKERSTAEPDRIGARPLCERAVCVPPSRRVKPSVQGGDNIAFAMNP